MGCSIGKSSAEPAAPAEAAAAPVEAAPAPTDKPKKSLETRGKKGGMLNALAMKFPTISKSFQTLYQTFEKHRLQEDADLKEKIPADKLKTCLCEIGGKTEWTDEEVKEIFKLEDLSGSTEVLFREFLISLAMNVFLKLESDDETFRVICKGFKVVEKAFNDMDADKGGSIDTQELKSALFATASSDDMGVLEARFAELDFDGDGDIMLPEFLYGMLSWVGFADDMEEKLQNKIERAETLRQAELAAKK